MNRSIYAIYDRLAKSIVGPLQVFPHDAPAIRMFSDLVGDSQTMVGRHPNDHELIRLGSLGEDCIILGLPDREVVVTGNAVLVARGEDVKS